MDIKVKNPNFGMCNSYIGYLPLEFPEILFYVILVIFCFCKFHSATLKSAFTTWEYFLAETQVCVLW